MGYAHAAQKSGDKAVEVYEQALSLDDKYTEALFNLGEAYLELAFREKDQNLIQKSSENFKKAIEIDPDCPYP